MFFACEIAVCILASIGIVLLCREIFRHIGAKRNHYVCLTFDSFPSFQKRPDMIIICRTDEEEQEIIRRVIKNDERRIFIKRW